MMWNDYWPMPWVFGPFMMIAVVVLCGAIMFFMIRGMIGGHSRRSDDQVALDILKERYARGEISQAEFEERRRFLDAALAGPPQAPCAPASLVARVYLLG